MNDVIEIKAHICGTPCTLEVGYEEGEIAVLSISPDIKYEDKWLTYDRDHPIFLALESFVDQRWLEDVISYKREQE